MHSISKLTDLLLQSISRSVCRLGFILKSGIECPVITAVEKRLVAPLDWANDLNLANRLVLMNPSNLPTHSID